MARLRINPAEVSGNTTWLNALPGFNHQFSSSNSCHFLFTIDPQRSLFYLLSGRINILHGTALHDPGRTLHKSVGESE